MNIIYSGSLYFEKDLSEEEVSELHTVIHAVEGIQIDKCGIYVHDLPWFPLNDAFYEWLSSRNNSMDKDSEIEYYGDCEGAFRWEGDKWVEYESMPLCDFADKYLIEELEYRGYDLSHISKKADIE